MTHQILIRADVGDNFLSQRRVYNESVKQIPPRLLNQLLSESHYDSSERPTLTDAGETTMITMLVYIRDISSVDEKSFSETVVEGTKLKTFSVHTSGHGDFTVDLDLQLTWLDRRLRFVDKTDTTPDSYLVVRGSTLKKIWMPDIYFENTKGEETMIQDDLKIYPDGTMVYTLRKIVVLACQMLLVKYPLDSQVCYIQIGSYAYTMREVVFRWNPTVPSAITKNDYITLPTSSVNHPEALPFCGNTPRMSSAENYTCLQGRVQMERYYEFHVTQSYLPSFLLVVSSWIGFWIDPGAVPARVSLSVTTLLSIVSQASAVRMGLPLVSYLKAIDVWMFVCMFYIFAALLEFCIMNNAVTLQKRGKTWCGDRFKCCDRKKKTDSESLSMTQMGSPAPPAKPPMSVAHSLLYNIDGVARYVFPISFIIFNIVYWTTYSVSKIEAKL